MTFVAPRFEARQHHPRWGNDWNTVRIRLTTWDAGNTITKFDVDAAHMVDAAYRDFKKGSAR
jgi:4a-hydroxytetrahydrobiopterin dehydratase